MRQKEAKKRETHRRDFATADRICRASAQKHQRGHLTRAILIIGLHSGPLTLVQLQSLNRMIEDGDRKGRTMAERRQIFVDLRTENFDAIRLSAYRTACKLRFVQKRCNGTKQETSLDKISLAYRENICRPRAFIATGAERGTRMNGSRAQSKDGRLRQSRSDANPVPASADGPQSERGEALHLVDVWNMIEAFRDNGLNTLDHGTELSISRLETIVSSVFHQLNKRLPTTHQIGVQQSINLLLSFLVTAHDGEARGKLTVFSLKVMLTIMCGGKMVDKLRCECFPLLDDMRNYMQTNHPVPNVFSQISDSHGAMIASKFDHFLKEGLKVPAAVCEGPAFGYTEHTAQSCFSQQKKVTLNTFLDTMMTDTPPQCLVWLPLMHRLADVENVFHPVSCSYCHSEGMMGFRYRCQQCFSYQLCQNCFWRGHANGNHSEQHQMKEHSSWKSPAKKLSHAISKSFGCVPSCEPPRPIYPENPEKPLDLSNIVPPRPDPNTNNSPPPLSADSGPVKRVQGIAAAQRMNEEHALIAAYVNKLQTSPRSALDSPSRMDEEHRLIARYTSRLASEPSNTARPAPLSFNASKQQRQLIAELENKNREILQEIQRLRLEHEQASQPTPEKAQQNPTLLAELRLLRQRKDELEQRMSSLQESRRELMVQLEGLMKLLKEEEQRQAAQAAGTPHAFPSPSASRPIPMPVRSAGSTPTHVGQSNMPHDSLAGVGGDVHEAFAQGARRNLRNDLLVAADSITNTMSSLVKELHTVEDGGDEEEKRLQNVKDRGAVIGRRRVTLSTLHPKKPGTSFSHCCHHDNIGTAETMAQGSRLLVAQPIREELQDLCSNVTLSADSNCGWRNFLNCYFLFFNYNLFLFFLVGGLRQLETVMCFTG
ncbi:hypothetical protein P4O66_019926 [Electrophorus voltai]|uniref:ZZ-type domain-containing protein n=1 Tax=Electrophorus voltai TaxID=2609070 RepID=A0AAD8ZUW0_9TELE|nr:hypothetical protein P4O66_019926 [Electrophorus voltai]